MGEALLRLLRWTGKDAKILKCNTNDFLQSPRISDSNKLNRNVLIDFFWRTDWYNRQEIGNLSGLWVDSFKRQRIIFFKKIDLTSSKKVLILQLMSS